MKKLFQKIGFASLMLFSSSVAAFAATRAGGVAMGSGFCNLIVRMHDVFSLLRTLAFVGAAFIIAGWAWGMIKEGKFDQEDLRKKGTGMLVGFVLLFCIGLVLSFFLSATGMNAIGCSDVILNW